MSGRRRLTLAPKPTGLTAKACEGKREVCNGFFADSDVGEEDERSPEDDMSFGSSVASSSPCADPLWGARKEGHGSRFWLLAGDDSSVEESEDEGRCGVRDLGRGPPGGCFSESLDSVRHENVPCIPATPEPGLSTCSGGNGNEVVEHSLSLSVEPSSHRDGGSGGNGGHGDGGLDPKPWRGPLPRRRSSPPLSLGDVWVKDLRSRGSKLPGRFGEILSRESLAGDVPAGRTSEKMNSSRSDADPDRKIFEFGQPKTFGVPGLGWTSKLGPGSKGLRPFRGATGLGLLFLRSGRPRLLLTTPRVPPAATLFASPSRVAAWE
jgi:hypothetical protein